MVMSLTKMNKNLSQNKNFFDKWAKKYDNYMFQFWMQKFQIPVLRTLEKESRDVKILDISCGSGNLLSRLVKLNFKNLYGIDVSSEMLKVAKKKLPPTVNLQQGDVHKLPYSDNFFDFVITTEAFHHYYSQDKALLEMKRVVNPKGVVIVVDINFFFQPIHFLFEKFEPGCVKVNSGKEICDLFKQSGLQQIKQQRNSLFAVMTKGRK
jgi:ubiquinone/menaquinone biosynthesis C-methylase UbiE